MPSHALSASFADSAENRAADRRVLRLEARVATPDGEGGISVHNLSRTGMLVEGAADVRASAEIEVELPGGTRHRAEVVWTEAGRFGCRFLRQLTRAQLSAALLRSAPIEAEIDAPPPPLTPAEALAKLREHWHDEPEDAFLPSTDRQLPLGKRLWIIAGLGLTGWAVPAAAAWAFW